MESGHTRLKLSVDVIRQTYNAGQLLLVLAVPKDPTLKLDLLAT